MEAKAIITTSRILRWVAIMTAILSLVFLVYKFDDRYFKTYAAENRFAEQEKKIVQTLEVFQMKIQEKVFTKGGMFLEIRKDKSKFG